jgi:hypothetical protein
MQRLFSMLILLVSLISQTMLIESLCPDAYMCPISAAWPHRPVLAPPVAFRRNAGFLATTRDYFHTTRNSCEYLAAGCADPGYSVQWPYLEAEDGSLTFPRQLSLSCNRRSICLRASLVSAHTHAVPCASPHVERLKSDTLTNN